jgi:hypothetical protein
MINITYIYLIENIDNDPYKVYIGKSKDPINRKSNHKITYGNLITCTVIDQINTFDRKYWMPIETMWIQTFMSWGYNVVNMKKEGGSGASFYTEEAKLKISKAKKNKPNPKLYKPVLQYDLNGNFIKEWHSAKAANEIFHINVITNNNMLSSSQRGGYMWVKKHNIIPPKIHPYKDNRGNSGNNNKPIIQYSIDNIFIQEWKSASHAAKTLHKNQPDISACCAGKLNHAGGYIWKYKTPTSEEIITDYIHTSTIN